MSKRVFIGVGHGGSDPGAVANGIKEANANLVMALALKEELDRHGVITGISRLKDENDPLQEEIREANAFAPDLAVECHNNAGGGDGFEVFYQTNGYKAVSLALAKAIEAEVKKLGQNSRGCKTKLNAAGKDYFGWLRQLNCPAVLCEGFFVDSNDHFIADTEAKQKAFGIAYAKGVLASFGITNNNGGINQAQDNSAAANEIKTGDIVQFTGGAVYVSANAQTTAQARQASKCKVTQVHNGKHPYHLISQDGKGVYGWVDADTIVGGRELAVGVKVKYSGPLYTDSYGSKTGNTVNGTYTVSKLIKGRKCGVLLNNGLGWIPESACTVI